MLTTTDDSLGPTEISYLEHRFCQLASQTKRYVVKNGNDPTSGNISEEKMCELEDFIDYAKLVIAVLGHKIFEPSGYQFAVSFSQSEKVNRIHCFALRHIRVFNDCRVTNVGVIEPDMLII